MKWRQLKHFCAEPPQYGLNISSDSYVNDGVRLLRTTDIRDDGTLTPTSEGVFVDADSVGTAHWLQVGDLLFSRAGSLGRAFLTSADPLPMTFAGYLVRFRPRPDTDARYIQYCAYTDFFQAAIAADAITSTISNFNAERYGNLELPARTEKDQRAIADFLDTETARIDALISKKQQMIELLDARWRSGVRHRMQSLSASHGYIALKRLIKCLDGSRIPLSAEERASRSGEYPYFGASGQIDTVDDYLFDETLVLLGEDGAQLADPDYEISFVVSGRVWVNNHAHVLRPIAADPWFLAAHLSTVDRALVISGATREKITQTEMNEIPVPAVPLREQKRIARILKAQRTRLDRLVMKIHRQLVLLQEHRQALITAAVTGELDVPGKAA